MLATEGSWESKGAARGTYMSRHYCTEYIYVYAYMVVEPEAACLTSSVADPHGTAAHAIKLLNSFADTNCTACRQRRWYIYADRRSKRADERAKD